jgi:pyruvate/2-oxoglutarate dehydrogenase complex dihydrolipoamide dehydrogenase (E3) component
VSPWSLPKPRPYEHLAEAEKAGISIRLADSQFEIKDGSIHVSGGLNGAGTFDVLYPALGCSVGSELAVRLGAASNEVGCLVVDGYQQTVDGIFAAGDVVSDLHQISVATGHAAVAVTAIHKSLGGGSATTRSDLVRPGFLGARNAPRLSAAADTRPFAATRREQAGTIQHCVFAAAELRLGGENQQKVRIIRTDGRPL